MKSIHILTGEKGQGKSELLKEIFAQSSATSGILSLRREGDMRDFFLLSNGATWPMQGEEEYRGPWLEVGRFRFSAEAFRKAGEELMNAARNPEVKLLIIDEIGPLELRGEGFAGILKTLLEYTSGPDLLLVVRSGLLQEVQQYFGLENAQAVTYDSLFSGFY